MTLKVNAKNIIVDIVGRTTELNSISHMVINDDVNCRKQRKKINNSFKTGIFSKFQFSAFF